MSQPTPLAEIKVKEFEQVQDRVLLKEDGGQQNISVNESSRNKGLRFERYFTKAGVHPYDEISWVKRDAVITNEKGKVVFEQKGVEFPDFWSDQAIKVVVSRYFRGQSGTPQRETSVRQVIDRIIKTVRTKAEEARYFASKEDAQTFEDEMTHLMVNQYLCFNSPVLFNVGVHEEPQTSACFILNVEDTMESILNWYKEEGMIFKFGSGAGLNISKLRAAGEPLKVGGSSSGAVSFMRGADAIAGSIKSGGSTRRAAKMVIMDADHPDIHEFIWCKTKEEDKARALAAAGYDMSVGSNDWNLMYFQNANNSVRVTDEFMNAVVDDKEWSTKRRVDGKIVQTMRARELMHELSEAAWKCADPGMQYDTIINKWHTCPNSDRIYASNPCSEYMFLNNTSCNLASINLMKFRTPGGGFHVEAFQYATQMLASAMEMLILFSGYPTPTIKEMSREYRTLGIGYANLGALLMAEGLPYDSSAGRNYSAAITALLSGESYAQSARIASFAGPFMHYENNAEPMMKVINMHRYHAYEIPAQGVPADLLRAARKSWDLAAKLGEQHGFRNAQISVLAPTGTISFFMDCDTTGVEPDIALVRYKWLVEKGMIKMVNKTVPLALETLGYSETQIKNIIEYIELNDTIEGAPDLKEDHLSVFDCAFKPANGKRSIHYMGHLRMMAAVQPFISGAISKTVNLPESSTVEDVMESYIQAWRLGLKAIAIYRDGSKNTQIYTTTKDKKGTGVEQEKEREGVFGPVRRKLPDERKSVTHKFTVAGHEGFLTVGLYEDGKPGEIFINMTKTGSTVYGLLHAFAISTSMNLQYGVPLRDLVRKFAHLRFEPSGMTKHNNIRIAKSIIDYIFRWMAWKFLPSTELAEIGLQNLSDREEEVQPELPLQADLSEHISNVSTAKPTDTFVNQSDAPSCSECGSIMVRNAACYKCLNCGATSGCS